MAKDTPPELKTLWAAYCRLIVRSQTLSSDNHTYDQLIRRMEILEQALATSPARSLDELVIKLDLLAWILFPPADPGAGDDSGTATSNGVLPLFNHAIPTDTTEGLLLGQILADAHQLAARSAGCGVKDTTK